MFAGLSALNMVLILLAGIGAGFVGYAVGVASLVSYPAVLAMGIPPVIANVSNTVGVVGMGIGSMIGAQKDLRGQRRRAAVYVVMGAVGGILGAFLLLKLDPKVFEFLVPPLILFSAIVIAVNPHGRNQVKQAVRDATTQAQELALSAEQAAEGSMMAGALDVEDGTANIPEMQVTVKPIVGTESRPMQSMSQDPWWLWTSMSLVGVYAGYFGAGAGTVALAVLDAGEVSPFHQINALKTVIGTGANIAATLVFVIHGVVNWPVAILLGIGCFLGGCIAPPITRRIPVKIMRMAAVAAGVILALNLGMKTYL